MADTSMSGIAPPVKLLIAIFDARDEWEGRPLEEVLIHRLEAEGIAGATLIHGLAGYGAHRGVHRRGLIGLPHDKPTLLLVADNEHRLRGLIPVVRPMIKEGILMLVDAEVIPMVTR